MATTGGDSRKKLHETLHDVPSPLRPDAAGFSGTETAHDDVINEQSPDSAQIYIKNFKKTLNREGDKQSS